MVQQTDLADDQINAVRVVGKFIELPYNAFTAWYDYTPTIINKKGRKSQRNELTISGPAGSGKTTCIKFGIGYQPIVVAALSHQATNVIRDSFTDHLPDNMVESYTIASLVGAKSKVDIKTGKLTFIPNRKRKKPPISQPGIYIIDECSQCGDDILEWVRDLKHPDAKIIWLGDSCQLPPIVDNKQTPEKSPTFNIIGVELTSVKRFGTIIQNFVDLYTTEIRECLRTGKTPDIDVVNMDNIETTLDGEEGIFYVPSENEEDIINSIVYAFNKDPLNTKIIGYRNKAINQINELIRNQIYSEADEEIVPGEYLICNSPFIINEDITVRNNQLVQVKEAEKESITVYYNLLTGTSIKDWRIENKTDEIECYVLDIGLYKRYDDKTPDFINYVITDKPKRHDEPILIPIPTKKGKEKYKKILDGLNKSAISEKDIALRAEKWKEYYNFMNTFGNFSYHYACTSHKAQGSTYDTVYVFVNDILTVSMINDLEKLQSLYVALSRAAKQLIIIH